MSYDHQKLSSRMAHAIRFLAADAINRSKSGHPGMPLGMADVATVLFSRYVKINPAAPRWFDRDRFVLSAGHGSMLLYSLLYLLGYEDISLEDIKNFRQLGAKTAGHPEYGHLAGVEMTTGPLGQGIASAVGMAMAERRLNARFGDALCSHYTYVIAGDGCLMEGISEEAIALAGHWKLNKLIVFWDNNNITIDGTVDKASSVDQIKRFEAAGWKTLSVDGHDQEAVAAAIDEAHKSDRPVLVACKTVIGFGAPAKQGTSACHGSPLGDEERAAMAAGLQWPYAQFEIPADVLSAWREAGRRSLSAYDKWCRKAAAAGAKFDDVINNRLPKNWDKALNALKNEAIREQTKAATRKASQMCLEKIVPHVPEIIGGSADLAASNLTFVKGMKTITAEDYDGNNLMYGIREHAMGAIMNGLALHGGVIPYGGTFFVFSDYVRLYRRRRRRPHTSAGGTSGLLPGNAERADVPSLRRGGNGGGLAAGADDRNHAEPAGAEPAESAAAARFFPSESDGEGRLRYFRRGKGQPPAGDDHCHRVGSLDCRRSAEKTAGRGN